MNSLLAKAALLSLSITLSPVLMKAGVVFSNVTGIGDALHSSVFCGSSLCNNVLAEEFTPSANYNMTDAQVQVKQNPGTDATFDVFLYSNNAGAPGSVIEQIGFALTATTPTFPGSLITANSLATPITLTSGTSYWLVLAGHEANSEISWVGEGSPAVPAAISLDGGNSWPFSSTHDGQFQIDGTLVASPTPEPSSVGEALAGMAALFYGIRRRQQKAS
jgi:hypothetical protein